MKRTIPIGESPPSKSLMPSPQAGSELALVRQAVREAPLIAARGLTSDLLSIHGVNLSKLTKAIQKPGMLLDEDDIPHKLILERISFLQKDILAASNTLLKLEEALSPQNEKTAGRSASRPIAEADKLIDVNAIVLKLANNQ